MDRPRILRCKPHFTLSACLAAVAFAAHLVADVPAAAQQPTQPQIDGAEQLLRQSPGSVWPVRSLRCIFGDGFTASWVTPERVTLRANTWSSSPEPVFFDNINAQTGVARLIGNAGATDVLVVAGPRNVVFLEQTAAGNMIMTTVYGAPSDGNWFPAVMSRHITLTSGPFASSYHGRCLRTD